MLCGGAGNAKPADDEVKALCAQVKAQAETHASKTFAMFEAVEYKTQVVAGTNYFVKVKVADNEHIHIRVYELLPCYGGHLYLHGIKHGHEGGNARIATFEQNMNYDLPRLDDNIQESDSPPS